MKKLKEFGFSNGVFCFYPVNHMKNIMNEKSEKGKLKKHTYEELLEIRYKYQTRCQEAYLKHDMKKARYYQEKADFYFMKSEELRGKT